MGTRLGPGSAHPFPPSARVSAGLAHLPPPIWKMTVPESLPVRRNPMLSLFFHLTSVDIGAWRWERLAQGHRLSHTSWGKSEWKSAAAQVWGSEDSRDLMILQEGRLEWRSSPGI